MKRGIGFLGTLLVGLSLPPAKADPIKDYVEYKRGCSGAISDVRCVNRTNLRGGRQIIVDTRDQFTCHRIINTLRRTNGAALRPMRDEDGLDQACALDSEHPFTTITVYETGDQRYVTPSDLTWLKSTEPTLQNQTRNLGFVMVASMVALWASPSAVSNWNEDTRERVRNDPLGQYLDNVKNGPVMDKDDAFFNYVAHPLAGAGYYLIARNLGHSEWESFGYSAAMSTFFWEYGFEALAEKPSIQDILITPIIGSLLGEAVHQFTQMIHVNDNRLLGSKRLGAATLIIFNPLGATANAVNRLFGSKLIQGSHGRWYLERRRAGGPMDTVSVGHSVGYELTWIFL